MALNSPKPVFHEARVSAEHPELFHYTSIRALCSLLETDTIWATHTAHLNDTSEMKQIVRSLQRACIDRMRATTDKQGWEPAQTIDFARALGSEIALAVREALLGNSAGSASVFVSSFSSHKPGYIRQNGMLSQWRGYGGPDGVAIIFETKRLEELLQQEASRFRYLWCGIADVIYDFGDFKLGDRFPRLVQELEDFVHNLAEDADESSERVLNNRLVEELPPAMARVKHHAFSEETECRFIVAQPSPSMANRLQALEQGSRRTKSMHHRPGHRGSIPYIRLFEGLKEERGGMAQLPITEVLVGPSRNQDAHRENVEELVARYGGPRQINVRMSEIPFVGSS